jgi:hypothetical protein
MRIHLKLSLVALTVLSASLSQACASAGHLAEYDFRGRNLASVNLAPPRPEIFSSGLWSAEGQEWWSQLIRVGTEIAREVQADEARKKLEEAAETVDVATLMADRVLEQGARLLRAQPVTTIQEADFEIETRIKQYGIQANSWDAQASFFFDAEVSLLDSRTGRKIWDADVQASDPINPSGWGAGVDLGNIITAQALARLSVEEIQLALRALADYSAEAVVDELAAGLEKAGKR